MRQTERFRLRVRQREVEDEVQMENQEQMDVEANLKKTGYRWSQAGASNQVSKSKGPRQESSKAVSNQHDQS